MYKFNYFKIQMFYRKFRCSIKEKVGLFECGIIAIGWGAGATWWPFMPSLRLRVSWMKFLRDWTESISNWGYFSLNSVWMVDSLRNCLGSPAFRQMVKLSFQNWAMASSCGGFGIFVFSGIEESGDDFCWMYGVCGLKSWVLLGNMGCMMCFVVVAVVVVMAVMEGWNERGEERAEGGVHIYLFIYL